MRDVDYISKPFQFEEVYARVETHLKILTLQRELKWQNEQLEEMVTERTRELADAHAKLAVLLQIGERGQFDERLSS